MNIHALVEKHYRGGEQAIASEESKHVIKDS